MNHKLLTRSLLAAGVALAVSSAQAAEVRINGFASIVAGKTLNAGDDNTTSATAQGETAFTADIPSNGVYDDNLDFKPDSNFGLQFSADLGEGLSVTGQITGHGGEDYEAKVSWAYVSYELNDEWTVIAGRQRIPFFFYSDFLDVGYAYHWMRAPIETNVVVDSFDGIQARWNSSIGNWDTRTQFYTGSTEAVGADVGSLGLDNIMGAVFYASNDWLQLRATYMQADIWFDELAADSTTVTGLDVAPIIATAKDPAKFEELLNGGQGEDNPMEVWFGGVAAHATFGDFFAVAEYTHYEFEDHLIGFGQENLTGAYISLGYRMGSLTPHITFSRNEQDQVNNMQYLAGGDATLQEATEDTDSITIGVRWDFHPAAALKIEYQTLEYDVDGRDLLGTTFEELAGDREVDLISAGIDIIF